MRKHSFSFQKKKPPGYFRVSIILLITNSSHLGYVVLEQSSRCWRVLSTGLNRSHGRGKGEREGKSNKYRRVSASSILFVEAKVPASTVTNLPWVVLKPARNRGADVPPMRSADCSPRTQPYTLCVISCSSSLSLYLSIVSWVYRCNSRLLLVMPTKEFQFSLCHRAASVHHPSP